MHLMLLCMIFPLVLSCMSCGGVDRPKPIPQGKESFVGVWKSASGFELHMKADAEAFIKQTADAQNPDYDKLNIKVAPRIIKGIQVRFIGESTLQVIKPLLYAREYCIERFPSLEGGRFAMALNGVVFVKN